MYGKSWECNLKNQIAGSCGIYTCSTFALDAGEAKAALAEAQASVASAGSDAAKAEAQIAVEVAEEIVKACA